MMIDGAMNVDFDEALHRNHFLFGRFIYIDNGLWYEVIAMITHQVSSCFLSIHTHTHTHTPHTQVLNDTISYTTPFLALALVPVATRRHLPISHLKTRVERGGEGGRGGGLSRRVRKLSRRTRRCTRVTRWTTFIASLLCERARERERERVEIDDKVVSEKACRNYPFLLSFSLSLSLSLALSKIHHHILTLLDANVVPGRTSRHCPSWQR